ncbi:hypothetical protein [Pelagicoccus mobilis]|uniref:Uncharacterized protein n=1 Tax=Pelagicoccus mobilis TaxID=415221 RepID=A0A934RZ78_9BACT|nr:hypothetical protein [Pelagicoccus mobilis]MBK1878009.1 hypothetical protein [Pelagicoccus mobilis]
MKFPKLDSFLKSRSWSVRWFVPLGLSLVFQVSVLYGEKAASPGVAQKGDASGKETASETTGGKLKVRPIVKVPMKKGQEGVSSVPAVVQSPKPALSLQESERELFMKIERLRWKIDSNTEILDTLRKKRADDLVNEDEMVVHMEKEKALSERLNRDMESYLSLKEDHGILTKRIEALPAQRTQPVVRKTVVDADVIEGPQKKENKSVRGSASSLFDSIDTSGPIEGKTSSELLKKTVQEISEEQK